MKVSLDLALLSMDFTGSAVTVVAGSVTAKETEPLTSVKNVAWLKMRVVTVFAMLIKIAVKLHAQPIPLFTAWSILTGVTI